MNTIPSDVLSKKINEKVAISLKDDFKRLVKMASTKRDRDIIKGCLAKITSSNFVASLMNVKNRTSIGNCKDELSSNAQTYRTVESTSLLVRNDMTTDELNRL